MIDVEVIRENVSSQARQKLVRIGRGFIGCTREERHEFVRRFLGANGTIPHFGKMLHEQIDDAISKPLHFGG
jgi:hypothetical protein